jgi:hypothetical protein
MARGLSPKEKEKAKRNCITCRQSGMMRLPRLWLLVVFGMAALGEGAQEHYRWRNRFSSTA